jgi:hypothetical protein
MQKPVEVSAAPAAGGRPEAPALASSAPPVEPSSVVPSAPAAASALIELGGPTGPEPTRYGDWEKKGRCIDF